MFFLLAIIVPGATAPAQVGFIPINWNGTNYRFPIFPSTRDAILSTGITVSNVGNAQSLLFDAAAGEFYALKAGTNITFSVDVDNNIVINSTSGLAKMEVVDVQEFAVSANWTKPGTGEYVGIILVGGGGGGASGVGNSATASGGTGGGNGQTTLVLGIDIGDLGATEAVVIGAGGAGGALSAGALNAGASGGNSTFHIITAIGGGGSTTSAAATTAPKIAGLSNFTPVHTAEFLSIDNTQTPICGRGDDSYPGGDNVYRLTLASKTIAFSQPGGGGGKITAGPTFNVGGEGCSIKGLSSTTSAAGTAGQTGMQWTEWAASGGGGGSTTSTLLNGTAGGDGLLGSGGGGGSGGYTGRNSGAGGNGGDGYAYIFTYNLV